MQKKIEISGIWLRTEGDYIVVLVERNGEWHTILREYAPLNEMTISHIVEPLGIEQAIAPMGYCIRCGSVLNNVSPGFSIITGGRKVCTNCLQPGEEIARARGLT